MNVDIVKTAMFGKQIQSNDLNDAMAEYVATAFQELPHFSSSINDVEDFAQSVVSIELGDFVKKKARFALALVIGSEGYQLLAKDDSASITYSIDYETSKVMFTVSSKDKFKQEEQIEETFMNKPDGYTEEPIKSISDNDYPKEHIHPNRVYLEHIIDSMKPYMKAQNPTLEDYIVEAPVLLPKLIAESKF